MAVIVTTFCGWIPLLTITFVGRQAEDIILVVFAGVAGLLWLSVIGREQRDEDADLAPRLLEGLVKVTDAHTVVATFAGEMMQIVTDATATLAVYDERKTMELLVRSADAMAQLTEHYPTIEEDV